MTSLEKKVREAVEPIINKLSYEVYDVIYEKVDGENCLQIFIDKNDGYIDINDCEKVNDAITDLLDEKDFIKNEYNLEVSSPGLERRIRDDSQLKKSIGEKVKVNLYKKQEGLEQKEVVGILESFDEEKITLKIEDNKKGRKNSIRAKIKSKKEIVSQKIKSINDNAIINETIENKNKANLETDSNEEDNTIIIEKANISKMQTVFDF